MGTLSKLRRPFALSREELRNWLEDYLEDQLEVIEEFAASIERGKKDIAGGNIRVREPEQA
jgi:hypothetical protein